MFEASRSTLAKMSFSRIQSLNSRAQFPIIINAPMAGTATPAMATEVSLAGGFGFLGCQINIAPGSPELNQFELDMESMRQRLQASSIKTTPQMPVGIGFITGIDSIGHFEQTALPLIAKHTPAAVWLFAPDEEVNPHPSVIRSLKALDPRPIIFVQVGNIESARAALSLGADVLVCQGTDAGGHQFRRGKGLLSLVAAVKDMLATDEEFRSADIALVAAGGIVNGDGVAAAMAMDVDGVVMGTRFTVAEESNYPEFRKQAVLATKDGTQTLKSPFHDQLVNSALWGPLYDGRAIITEVHEKFLAGASLEDCKKSLQKDYSAENAKKLIGTWAGTGVGLVNSRQPSAEIVKEVRNEANEAIRKLADRYASAQRLS